MPKGQRNKNQAMTRAQKLNEMLRLYAIRPYTDQEMADQLDFSRETAFRCRLQLTREHPIEAIQYGRYRLNKTGYIASVKFNLTEALDIYLSIRRMARQTSGERRSTASALEKIAAVLKQPMTKRLVEAATRIRDQETLTERAVVWDRVVDAWINRQVLSVVYRSLGGHRPIRHQISPYLIEPALWSEGSYVIGYSDVLGNVGVFKIERMETAQLSMAPFVDREFDEQALIEFAWGIWQGEGEAEVVCLKFTTREVVRRVKENVWHPQQRLIAGEALDSCMWEAPISEPREMIPWIRGWGCDCEVMTPIWLRETIMGEVKALAERYGWRVSATTSSDASPSLTDTFTDFFGKGA